MMEGKESNFLEKFGLEVTVGTHPIPQKYYATHCALKTWNSKCMEEAIKLTLSDEKTRIDYD